MRHNYKCVQGLHSEIQRERWICSMGIQGHYSETAHDWNTLCWQHVRVLYLYLTRKSEGEMECICVPENPWIRFVFTPRSLTQMFCLVCIAEQLNSDSIHYNRHNNLQTKKASDWKKTVLYIYNICTFMHIHYFMWLKPYSRNWLIRMNWILLFSHITHLKIC